jgi:ribosomal protein S19
MTTIAKKFRRKLIYVHNGQIFRKRYMRRLALGNKLGAFIRTKIFGRYVLASLILKVKKKRLEKKKK